MARLFASVRCTCVLLLHLSKTLLALTSTGQTVILNDISYYAPPHVVATLAIPKGYSGGMMAITVAITKNAAFGTADLSALKSNFSTTDDVWQEGFSDALYLQYTGVVGSYSSAPGMGMVMTKDCSGSPTIPPGPYFLSASGEVFEAYRLYSDSIGAFTETVYSDPSGILSVLPAGVPGQNLAVAVPSRLYFTKTNEKPLAGVRIGVKDLFDLAGLRTSDGNRAWYHFYPPAKITGTAMQNLIDAGGIIVGKVKLSQFANGEQATADWVDYHEPFNPRGDGYQDTSTSSAGSGSAAGAYEWLDITVGSDTGGSIRGPAQQQGVFGNRPTHGLVSLDHAMTMAPELDTCGLLARDPVVWVDACKALYKKNLTLTSTYPTRILALDFPVARKTDGDALLLDFLDTVTTFLHANTSILNMTKAWADTSGISVPLEQYLNLTYPVLIGQHEVMNLRNPFYAQYGAVHDGRLPFVDPVPLVRWAFAMNTTATIAEAVANKTTFMNWFETKILVPDKTTCSDKLLIYAGSNAGVNYRNQYLDPPQPPFGYATSTISIFSEAPDMVVPIGQAEYFSTITNHTEYLPVTIDIMAAKGCDGLILSLILDLYKHGIVKASMAGGSNTLGGEILYKRDGEQNMQ